MKRLPNFIFSSFITIHMIQKLVFSLCAAAFILSANAQSVQGKLNLRQGQKYTEKATVNATTKMEQMGGELESQLTTTTYNQLLVKKNTGPDYIVESMLKRLVLSMSVMGSEQNYDSDNKDAAEPGQGDELLNKAITVSVDREGKILSVSYNSTINQSTRELLMVQNTLVTGAPFGALAVIGNGQPVKPGASWTDSVSTPNLNLNTVYTLKSVDGNEAVVTYLSKTSTKTIGNEMGMEMTVSMAGTIEGELLVDLESGIVKKRNATLHTTGVLEAAGQEIPISTVSTIESEITPD